MAAHHDPLSAQQKQAVQNAVQSALAVSLLDDAAEPWQRFSANLFQTLLQRHALGEQPHPHPVTFVMVERSQRFASKAGAFRMRDLDTVLEGSLDNKVVLVGENANGGVAFDAPSQAAVDDLLNELELESKPTAVIYPASRKIRIYPEGLANLDCQVSANLPAPQSDFSIAALVDLITEFHDLGLCIPENTGSKLWTKQSSWLPCSEAEKEIQWPLRMALVFGFAPGVLVKHEHPNSVGTADFAFYSATSPMNSTPLAILETKVQKSFRDAGAVSPSETAREFVRGIVQTAAYKKATSAPIGVMACFDLRKPAEGSDAAWSNAKARGNRAMKRLGQCAPEVFTWVAFADTKMAQAYKVAGRVFSKDPLFPVSKRPDLVAKILAA